MSTITISGATLTNGLLEILMADDIEPGSIPSYQMCKLLWTLHPLGGKIVEKSVALALGQRRRVNVPGPLEDQLVKAFNDEWDALTATEHIRDVMHLSRAYGAGAIAWGFPDLPTDRPLGDLFQLSTKPGLYFNTYDPLNLAGSMVTNQDPNAPDFMKPLTEITAAGQPYHSSRTCKVFHGTPVYLDYQSSSFSFAGRSIFLRALYPLKSFINTMRMNDLVASKAGLLIEKVKPASNIISKIGEAVAGVKRNLLKEGYNGNVLSIGINDSIESLNFTNIDGAMTTARDNIISDIAASTDEPAILLKDESFAKGLATGEEDMKGVALHIGGLRTKMNPLHAYFDKITQYRAWNVEFFTALQAEFPDDLSGKDYRSWFYEVVDRFETAWPDFIVEEESVKTERNAKKVDAVQKLVATVAPLLDPVNKAALISWAAEILNDMPELFRASLVIDQDALAAYEPPLPEPGGLGGNDKGGGGGKD